MERQAYVDAAVCLTQTQSPNDSRVSIHDDFSYLHSRIGNYSHDAAPFLPWHRYFIHAYEKALKDHCGYKGTLPYWDWSKDYENVLESPIWDTDAGFGPNGDPTGPEGVSKGHCVRNGSFAGWTPAWYQGEYRPHCLSRGFLDVATAEKVSGRTVRPEILEAVVADETNFFNFTVHVEDVSHLTVPFLYNGPAQLDGDEEGMLTDLLEYGGFLPFDPSVGDLMDTEGDLLCYRYDVGVVGSH
ncbi:Di-copper centre-containing protein [Penicillium frequentans]|uniref:Di-copper centre-containing protein n=1 Tax=Penicillium frequentans TaxID=3151616 RepID=A0AAD6D391_9EURO|nr:Di-copper centre-containing protein [Penicillium glabrum]